MDEMNTSPEQWQERLKAVLNYVDIVKNYIPDLAIEPDAKSNTPFFPQGVTSKKVLEQLQNFGKDFFNFFYYGLHQDGDKGFHFETHPDITTDVAFWRILDQISNDVTVLQQALGQRSNSIDNSDSPVAQTLKESELQAWRLRQKFGDYLDRNTTVLTYFNKSPNVRLIPYAPIALIGISATSLGHTGISSAEDPFIVIAHEFAHHVYWYGRVPAYRDDTSSQRIPLYKRVQEFIDDPKTYDGEQWVHNWAEEIFCDMVGCLVHGEKAVEALQKMLLSTRYEEFFVDHGTHPTPALRPYITIETLKLLNKDSISESHDLQSFWEKAIEVRRSRFEAQNNEQKKSDKLLDGRSIPKSVTVQDTHGGSVEIQEPVAVLRPLLEEMISILEQIYMETDSVKITDKNISHEEWWPKHALEIAVDLGHVDTESFTKQWVDNNLEPNGWITDIRALLDSGKELRVKNLPIDNATELLNSGGWTTGGPRMGHGGGG